MGYTCRGGSYTGTYTPTLGTQAREITKPQGEGASAPRFTHFTFGGGRTQEERATSFLAALPGYRLAGRTLPIQHIVAFLDENTYLIMVYPPIS